MEIFYHAGSGGFDFSGTPNAIEGAPWNETTKSWKYDITTLSDGKHSLLIEGQDLNGNLAYDLLVPFWTGNQSDFIWDDALIYMIMTDRFVNGNSSNDGDVTNALARARICLCPPDKFPAFSFFLSFNNENCSNV